jgi:signal transduction histidine kinase
MHQKNKGGCKPFSVSAIFLVYFVIATLGSLALLFWGRRSLSQSIGVFTFSAALLCVASVAGTLSVVGDALFKRRALFWFGMAHLGVWISGLPHGSWAKDSRLASNLFALSAGIAFLLLYFWLIAEGEFSRNGLSSSPIKIFDARASTRLMSQYERKIRQAAAQEERNRLARDLHDSIKQQIFAIQTAAATAQTRFEGDANGAREALDQIRSSAREAMTEMEVMLDQLRAEPLESTGLVAALKKLCESIGFRSGAQVDFRLGAVPPNASLSPVAAEATLRVAQEALANVARHARAAHVQVSLDSIDDRMELTVEDDGAGFDLHASPTGMGTANMRARAEELGGKLDLVSSPNAGTTVKFSIPSTGPSASSRQSKQNVLRAMIVLWWAGMMMSTQWRTYAFLPALVYMASLAILHYVRMARLNGNA